MMTDLAIHGDGLKEMKFRRQVPYLAFLCALKGDRADNYTPPEDKDFDGTNFIWADQKEVSKSLEAHKLLATLPIPGSYRPRLTVGENLTVTYRS